MSCFVPMEFLNPHQENMSVKCIHLVFNSCIVKLGFTGVLLIFLILIQNIDCGYSLECVPTINIFSKTIKNIELFPMNFSIVRAEKISV